MSSFPPAFIYIADDVAHRRHLAEKLNNMLQGKLNATGTVTLAVSATTTTLIDSRIGASSFIELCPLSANAATALPAVWFSNFAKGSCTINHASSAHADQTFTTLIIG